MRRASRPRAWKRRRRQACVPSSDRFHAWCRGCVPAPRTPPPLRRRHTPRPDLRRDEGGGSGPLPPGGGVRRGSCEAGQDSGSRGTASHMPVAPGRLGRRQGDVHGARRHRCACPPPPLSASPPLANAAAGLVCLAPLPPPVWVPRVGGEGQFIDRTTEEGITQGGEGRGKCEWHCRKRGAWPRPRFPTLYSLCF